MTKIEEIIRARCKVQPLDVDALVAEVEELMKTAIANVAVGLAQMSFCPACLRRDATGEVCAGCGQKLHS